MKYKTTLYIDRPSYSKALMEFYQFKYVGKKKIKELGTFYVYEYTGFQFGTDEIADLMRIIDDCHYYCPFVSINRPAR
jgi:hypothetical protein